MFFEVTVDAVVADVQLAPDEPLPKGRIAGVESGVPIVVPVEELGVFVEAFREMFFAEFLDKSGIGEIGLGGEASRRVEVFFFFPVDGDLSLGDVLSTFVFMLASNR